MNDLPLAIDLDDTEVAGLGDHGEAVSEALDGVDLDAAGVALFCSGGVFPDDRFIGRDFEDGRGAVDEEDVAVSETGDVVRGAVNRIVPFDLA